VVALGTFSYSLYLIHYPLLSLSYLVYRTAGLGPRTRWLALMAVSTPLCIVAASLFARVFERPFLPRRSVGAPTTASKKSATPLMPTV
jgi:peptidoglycan/LPS O-acetylase OafA/YrhL